ncbi:hypothetical protein ACRB8A_19205 (plasmid) [Arthrobacter sp. G.S.26]|uniref:hypothetical protein n=1 Tax=Arthrobacter sp. G.S.26 TaxID=3433706 RepID=UPI003D77476C
MHQRGLQERAAAKIAVFRNWVSGLELDPAQQVVLTELLGMMPASEFVAGRAACVTEAEELGRRTGLGESVGTVLEDLETAGLLNSHLATKVSDDQRSGVVLRVRRPDVVLTVEAAGPLWMKDSWLRTNGIRRIY